jgi:hypothetical protein
MIAVRSLWIAAILLSGCEREAPSCDVLARHAALHIHARPFFSDADRVRLRIKLPFRVALTEDDRSHVERACADWDAEYKLCVIDSRGSGFRCGPEDVVWSTLPHVERWHDDLASAAANASWFARQRADAADLELERVTAEIAFEQRLSDAGPRDFVRPASEVLERARAKQRQAHTLVAACEVSPLEQDACVALLP